MNGLTHPESDRHDLAFKEAKRNSSTKTLSSWQSHTIQSHSPSQYTLFMQSHGGLLLGEVSTLSGEGPDDFSAHRKIPAFILILGTYLFCLYFNHAHSRLCKIISRKRNKQQKVTERNSSATTCSSSKARIKRGTS